jgi:hypothetical protein
VSKRVSISVPSDMNCPVHPRREVVGYCAECGAVGCDQCVKEVAKRKLCIRCYKKAQREWVEDRRKKAVRKRHPKQRLVVRFVDGRMLKGTSYTIDTSARGFYVDPRDASSDESKQVFVRFSDLKAVFFVRDFDGKFDKGGLQTEWHPEGLEIAVKFKDGEVIDGYTLTAYDERVPRFHLIPREPGNNVSVLIERASVAQVAVGGGLEPEASVPEEGEQAAGPAESAVSKEETLGDFYFHTKNYFAALTEYDKAFKEDPGSGRLRRKVAVSTFNVGVHYVKVKDYKRALQYFDEVLKYEPKNREARKKIQKLRRIIASASESKEEVNV